MHEDGEDTILKPTTHVSDTDSIQGHRLGTAEDARQRQAAAAAAAMDRADEVPQPVFDENMTDEDRARIRAERAAAAEARAKKANAKPKKTSSTPLVGPNSQPTLRWTAG